MPISQDPNDPNFGLETDVSSPNFGLPPQAEPSVVQPSVTEPSQSREATRPTFSLPNLTESIFGPQAGQAVRNAQEAAVETVKGFIPRTPEQVASFATPVVGAVEDIGKAGRSVYDTMTGQTVDQAVAQNYPEATALAEAEKTPPFSKERFTTGFNVLGQLGMAGAIAHGISPRPTLTESIFGKTEAPPIQETPEAPVPVISEQVAAEIPKEVTSAVQEPSTGEILQRQPQEVGAPGGERAGVEQGVQGQETPQTRTEEVIPVLPEQPIDALAKAKSEYPDKPEGWSQERYDVFLKQRADALEEAFKRESEFQRLNQPASVPQPEQPIEPEFQSGDKVFLYSRNGTEMTEVPVELLPDTHVRPLVEGGEATPIEDYGDYILSHQKLSEKQAFDQLLKNIGEREPAPAPKAEGATTAAPLPKSVSTTGEPLPKTEPSPEKPPIQTTPESGISTERLQNIYGKDAVLITKGKSPEQFKAIGEADTRDPYAVLSKSQQAKIALPEDVPVLRKEHQRLLAKARAAYGTPEYNDLAQQAVDFANATKEVAHGPASEIFRSVQQVDKPTYTSPADFDNIVRERIKRESTPQEKEVFQKASNDVNKSNGEVTKSVDEARNNLNRYKPKETMKFEDAVDQIRKQIAELTKDCGL